MDTFYIKKYSRVFQLESKQITRPGVCLSCDKPQRRRPWQAADYKKTIYRARAADSTRPTLVPIQTMMQSPRVIMLQL